MFGERAVVVAGDGDGDEFRRNRRRFFQRGDAFRRVAAAREAEQETVRVVRDFVRRLGDEVGAGSGDVVRAADPLDGGGEDVADVGGGACAAIGNGRRRVMQGVAQLGLEYRVGGGKQGGDLPPAVALLGEFTGGGGGAASGEVAGVLSEDQGVPLRWLGLRGLGYWPLCSRAYRTRSACSRVCSPPFAMACSSRARALSLFATRLQCG